MSWSVVLTFLRHELRMVYRDTRTILLSVVLPIALMPLLLVAVQALTERRESAFQDTIFSYAVTGSRADWARDALLSGAGDRLREAPVADPLQALEEDQVDVVVQALSGGEADAEDKNRTLEPAPPLTPTTAARRLPGVPVVRILFRADQNRSIRARQEIEDRLVSIRRDRIDETFQQAGFPLPSEQILQIESVNRATDAEVTGAMVGPYVTALLVLLLLGGGSVAAMDILAGEKERGSMETLLTTAARPREIVAAKQVTVLLVAVGIAVIQVVNILLYVTLRLVELPENFQLAIPPAGLAALLVCFVPLATLLAAVLLAVSGRSSSYKEAQLLYFPVFVVCVALGCTGVLPEVELRSVIAMVPLANVGVAVREVFIGHYDWPMLLVAAAVNLGVAGFLVSFTARSLTSEELIKGPGQGGREESFSRAVLTWFAVMAAALVVIPPNLEVLAGLTGQVLFNQLVIFLGAPLLMVWLYRLDPTQAFALRPVQPPVWLAVLLLIPACQLASVGVVKLTEHILPIPTKMLEEMAKMLVPEGVGPLQLVFLIAVLPGICEELAFRGTLLYGLRRRLRPLWLVLAVGAIFGAFHFSYFRVIPTGFTGTILAAVAVLTGSIFPGIVIHIGNNALAVWAFRNHVALDQLPGWVYLVAMVAIGVAFGILWRSRTLYPGLLGVSSPKPPEKPSA